MKKLLIIFLCIISSIFVISGILFGANGMNERMPEDVLDKAFPENQFLKFSDIIKKANNNSDLILKGDEKKFDHPGLRFSGPIGMFDYLPDYPVVMIEYEDSSTSSAEMFGDTVVFVLLLPSDFNKFRDDVQKIIDEEELIKITMNILNSGSGFVIVDFRYYDSVQKERHFWPNPNFFEINDVRKVWSYPKKVINALY